MHHLSRTYRWEGDSVILTLPSSFLSSKKAGFRTENVVFLALGLGLGFYSFLLPFQLCRSGRWLCGTAECRICESPRAQAGELAGQLQRPSGHQCLLVLGRPAGVLDSQRLQDIAEGRNSRAQLQVRHGSRAQARSRARSFTHRKYANDVSVVIT